MRYAVSVIWDSGRNVKLPDGESVSISLDLFEKTFLASVARQLQSVTASIPQATFWQRVMNRQPGVELSADVQSVIRAAIQDALQPLRLKAQRGDLT